MKKKLIFCICLILIAVIGMSTVPYSAFTYDFDVPVSSAAMMLINTDTSTVVYEKNVDTARYQSYLSHIMTFLIVNSRVSDIEKEKVEIKQEVLDRVEFSDKTLQKYVGKSLTVEDLLYFLMLQSGTDAAYVLADYVTNSNIDQFVKLMNDKARSLGCTKTNFVSPAMSTSKYQYTTCRDLYKIEEAAQKLDIYKEISGTEAYLPSVTKDKKQAIYNKNSLLKHNSPYYFRYVTNGKFGYNPLAGTNVVATCVYRNVTYIIIALGAKAGNEQNALTEAKQMFIWAYRNLGIKQIISESTVLETITSNAVWGESDIELTSGEDIYRMMPADFEDGDLKLKFEVPDKVNLPIFKGQNLGTAKMYYEGKYFDEINMIAGDSEGISLLDDMGSFLSSMYDRTIPEIKEPTQAETKPTEAKKPAKKTTKKPVATTADTKAGE